MYVPSLYKYLAPVVLLAENIEIVLKIKCVDIYFTSSTNNYLNH